MFATSVATGTREWFCEDARLSIEKWPEGLLALSAPSRAVPMSRGTIAAVLRNSDLYCGDEAEDEDAEGEASDDRANEELVRTLTEQIDDHVRAFGGAAFVKIGRSPKDVVYCEASEALERRLYEELTKIAESMDGTETPAEISNLELIAFTASANSCLQIRSGKEAVQLLFNQSVRVNQDLQRTLELSAEEYPCSVIVRQWVQISPCDEYRVFIHDGNLTAISQYYHHCFFGHSWCARIPEVSALIQEYYQSRIYPVMIEDRLAVPSYLPSIFFLVHQGHVFLIELNPLHYSTDACCFSWNNRTDVGIVLSPAQTPSRPPTVRWVQAVPPIEETKGQIVPYWARKIAAFWSSKCSKSNST